MGLFLNTAFIKGEVTEQFHCAFFSLLHFADDPSGVSVQGPL